MKNTTNKPARYASYALLLMAGMGCSARNDNRLTVVDHPPHEPPQVHTEQFDEAWFSIGHNGKLDVVLCKKSHGEGGDVLVTQLLHIRTFWKPNPGRTFASPSMLSANVSYCILRGISGITYDGGAFFQYRLSKDKQRLEGTLEGSGLKPLRKVGEDLTIFNQVQIEAPIRARRDDRMTTHWINLIPQRMGPLPQLNSDYAWPDY